MRQASRQALRHSGIQAGNEADRQAFWLSGRQAGRPSGRQACKEYGRRTGRPADMHAAGKHACMQMHTGIRAGRLSDRQTGM